MVLTNTSEKNEVDDPIPGLLYQRGIGLFIDQLSISCESGSGRVIRKAETTPGWTQPYFYILPSDFFYIDYFTVMKVPCKQQVINKMHIDCLTIQFNANYLYYALFMWPSHFSCVQLFVTLWTVAHEAPLSMGFIQARILEWVVIPFSRGSSQPKG